MIAIFKVYYMIIFNILRDYEIKKAKEHLHYTNYITLTIQKIC